MAECKTRRDPSRRSWCLAVTVALLLAPSAWAQPVARESPASLIDEDDASGEESAEAAAAVTDMEIRITKQIMLLQRQLNQLTTRLNAIEARTAE